ncbi:hypothetical protein QMK19_36410 [Streptomyces sp. H10-C2]|uniref:hypothetical protein n=1 Tax=unclassified Streptomyces TaxID=2593676 RepID=UPI0024BA072D|nr:MULTISPECIES: hypothetical protein [unclassified Streptomyces]MDJ0346353.1 hypothetical protein [Streptomyces sp. PH10-H1]MDJ0374957.1 hypothetical protein [Streptomyces sp. H10-C2]
MTLPGSVWARVALMIPVTLLITVLGLIWLICIAVPPARQYALEIGKQTATMMRALTR